eukprot:jgi/Botrbrau1/19706/Bobra.0003s0067.1
MNCKVGILRSVHNQLMGQESSSAWGISIFKRSLQHRGLQHEILRHLADISRWCYIRHLCRCSMFCC